MTVYELRDKSRYAEPHFFDRETLRFFGEKMSEMKVEPGPFEVTDYLGVKHTCVRLRKYSRTYPSGPRHTYAYFDTTSWKRILPADE